MYDDLQEAKASVGWAKSNFSTFENKLSAWLRDNVYIAVREQPPNIPNNVVVVAEKEPLPLAFQVEAGVYINAIRSSLDMLACTLANRHCPALVDDTYFPVVASDTVFLSGKGYKGNKFVKALPDKERGIIESLKPYRGENGNHLLCSSRFGYCP